MAYEVILPKLGETLEEGTILEWYKKEGDAVKRGEPLFQVESYKAAQDVEASRSGTLLKILHGAGSNLPVLTVLALIGEPGEDISSYVPGGAPAAAQPAEAKAAAPAEPMAAAAEATPAAPGRLFASPRARKRAAEEGVELQWVTGTGPEGRIEERDVLSWLASQPKATPLARKLAAEAGLDLRTIAGVEGRIEAADVERALAAPSQMAAKPQPAVTVQPPAAAQPAAAPVAPAAAVPLTGLRGIIARRMAGSHLTTAPVTLTMEADATTLVAVREELKAALAQELGFNIGYNDLLVKVAAKALREFPYMNARLVEEGGKAEIRQLPEVHVGVAVDAERGLLVPVIRNADARTLREVAVELRALVQRAREGKSLADDLLGGTFTITNLGMYEVDAFTPIINQPEAAILGVGRIAQRPAVVDGQLAIRSMMWLSLTFDHRLVDGAPAARFMQRIKQLVEKPMLLLA